MSAQRYSSLRFEGENWPPSHPPYFVLTPAHDAAGEGEPKRGGNQRVDRDVSPLLPIIRWAVLPNVEPGLVWSRRLFPESERRQGLYGEWI